jgi:asparagine synthase (glutamine-hydrolysing)
MSVIVGFWNPDSMPASSSVLARMGEATAHRPADEENRFVQGQFALAVSSWHLMPQRAAEPLPHAGALGCVCTLDGMLHNREELARACRWSPEESANKQDFAFVLAAYANWGDSFLEHLDGEFALVLFDPTRQKLFLARDLLGTHALYYAEPEGTIAFGSEIKNVLAHADVPTRPNDDALADLLIGGDANLNPETWFRGVYRVIPGTVLVRTRDSRAIRRFGSFDCTRQIRCNSFREYVELLQPALDRAVANRIRADRPVGVTVSGGFDSSTIYSLAQRLRSSSLPGPPIVGLSMTYDGFPLANEQEFLPFLEEKYSSAIQRLPVRPGFMKFARHTIFCGEAPTVRVHGDSEYAKWQACNDLGSRILLDGWFGDNITYNVGYWGDLLCRAQFGRLWNAFRGYCGWFAGARPIQCLNPLLQVSASILVPNSMRPPLRRLRNFFRPHPPSRWYRKAFTERGMERAIHQQAEVITEGSCHARHLYNMASNSYYRWNLEVLSKIAASFGVQPSSPFLDRELIQLVMAMPGEVLNWDYEPRALFREAVRGTLPEPIRDRKWKGDFRWFLAQSFEQEVSAIEALLASNSMAADLGYIHVDQFHTEIQRLRPRWLAGKMDQLEPVVSLVGLELWLRLFFGGESPPAAEVSSMATMRG